MEIRDILKVVRRKKEKKNFVLAIPKSHPGKNEIKLMNSFTLSIDW